VSPGIKLSGVFGAGALPSKISADHAPFIAAKASEPISKASQERIWRQ
jgi:hypothetical protein